jgi:hypothetical protein
MSIISKLNQEIEERRTKIAEIQAACSHPEAAVLSVPGACTGNYDPTCDSYWIDHECTLCQKKWREDKERRR